MFSEHEVSFYYLPSSSGRDEEGMLTLHTSADYFEITPNQLDVHKVGHMVKCVYAKLSKVKKLGYLIFILTFFVRHVTVLNYYSCWLLNKCVTHV